MTPQTIPYVIDQNLLLQEEHYIYDIPAERAFLACVMQRPDLIMEADRLVKPEWLFNPMHNYCFRVMQFIATEAQRNGWAIAFDEATALSVAKMAGEQFVQNFLVKTEGMAKWREIAEMAPYTSIDQFPRYAATLKDRAARVAMFRKARQLQMSVMDMAANPDAAKVAINYEAALSNIAFGSGDPDAQLKRLGEYSDNLLFKAKLNAAFPHKHLFHIRHPRFQYWMDLMGGGFRRNSLTIIAARPKVGKTTLLLNLASDFAAAGIPVLFLDTEMSGEEMVSRELSQIAAIDEHALIAGKFLNEGASHQAVYSAVERLKGAPLFYVSIAGKPIEFAMGVMRQFRNQHVGTDTIEFEGRKIEVTRPCVVFYDWLKLPNLGDARAASNEAAMLGDIATKLKDTAKSLNLPVVAGAQNNRNAVGKEESEHVENAESFVAGSDRLIQFCNTLCIIRNPTLKMSEAIEANWPGFRPGHEGTNAWRFNQILQIVVQRQGRDCRTGIPMYVHRGQARYEEMADSMSMTFLKEFIANSKQNKRGPQVGSGGPALPALQPPRPGPPRITAPSFVDPFADDPLMTPTAPPAPAGPTDAPFPGG